MSTSKQASERASTHNCNLPACLPLSSSNASMDSAGLIDWRARARVANSPGRIEASQFAATGQAGGLASRGGLASWLANWQRVVSAQLAACNYAAARVASAPLALVGRSCGARKSIGRNNRPCAQSDSTRSPRQSLVGAAKYQSIAARASCPEAQSPAANLCVTSVRNTSLRRVATFVQSRPL